MISTGNLGDNIIEKKLFYHGIEREIDYLVADAGTADVGLAFQKNSSGDSVVILTDEPLYPRNQVYQWTIDHVLFFENPLGSKIFRFKFEVVGE